MSNSAPILTGLGPSVTFAENTVNAAPQLLDSNITFTDPEGNFDTGTLTVTGLLAEDSVAIANQGTGAGQIGFSGGNVSYEGTLIGTATGGDGASLTVTFNADATSTAIDALIQDLTYANSSDTPTASRTLTVTVTDSDGAVTPDLSHPIFAELTGAANPFDGFDVGDYSAPTLADLDGDGDLDAVVGEKYGTLHYFQNTGAASAPAFAEQTGAANPFNIGDVGSYSTPTLADLDGDGDLDAVVGEFDGNLNYFLNTGSASAPVFAEQFGAANPFDGVAFDVGKYSTPTLADLDGDGDLDAVVGEFDGNLNYFLNTGSATAPVFAEQTGAANPFDGIDVGLLSTPTMADLDGDGDLDAMVGEFDDNLNYFLNTGSASAPVFVQQTGAANPFNGVFAGYISAPTLADLDGDGDIDAVVGERYGTLHTFQNTPPAGVPIVVNVTAENDDPTGTPTAVLGNGTEDSPYTVSAANLLAGFSDADLDTLSVENLGASNGTVVDNGNGTFTIHPSQDFNGLVTLTYDVSDGNGGSVTGVQQTYSLAAVNDAPVLTGLASSVTFGENTVNAAPQVLDSNVTFTDPEGNFNNGINAGTLQVFGILAEDTVAIANQGNGAGQIGFSGGNVSYGGILIGTAVGGIGGDLTVSFNASATSEAIDALIQDLTYANSSDTPTASRTLTVTVTDADGATNTHPVFSELTGAANPFNGFNVGTYIAPTLGDLDGDGDLDAVVGFRDGTVHYLENTGTASAPAFAEQTGAANPFDVATFGAAFDVGTYATPTLGDLDGDGDLDAVVGASDGTLHYFRNIGTASAPVFAAQTGAANPFDGAAFDVGLLSTPTLADLDGDGDLDAVVGELYGNLNYFQNTGTALAPVFIEQTGAANPFNGVAVPSVSAPDFADLDGDGDLDAVVGDGFGMLHYFQNTGTASAPVFAEQTGAANPFDGIDVGFASTPTLADLDGDGLIDAVVGADDGTLHTFQNTGTASAPVFAEQTGAANPFDGINVGRYSTPTLADLDGDGDLDAVVGADDGTLHTFQNTGSASAPVFAEQFGAANPFDGVAFDVGKYSTPTLADLDGDGDLDAVVGADDGTLHTFQNTPPAGVPIVVNVTAEAESPPHLTGLGPTATFAENTVNATPQIIDSDVNFTAGTHGFDTGTLTVSGLLAEDSVAIGNQGTGAGQIGFSAGNVSYEGTLIGTAANGTAGTDLTVVFNANATSEAIDALIQDLTYANSSDTPTASRTLSVTVTDAGGAATPNLAAPSFASAGNSLNSVDVGFYSMPTFADLDGDGDLDAVVGDVYGTLRTFQNTGDAFPLVFTELTGAANPFDVTTFGPEFDVGYRAAPTFADLDGDGDLDAVVGEFEGTLNYFLNTGDASTPVFEEQIGGANPFAAFDVGADSSPTFGDLDGDGDLDAVVGENDGTLNYFLNTGTTLLPAFTAQTGAANPFDVTTFGAAFDVGDRSAPSLADLDGDGDLDVMVGDFSVGTLNYFRNIGTASAPVFAAQTGAANPLDGFDTTKSAPTLIDLDDDGDLDAVVGNYFGQIFTFENTPAAGGMPIVVNVTAENDNTPPSLTGLAVSVTFAENTVNATPQILDSNVAFTDPDNNFNTGTLTVTGLLAEDSVAIRNVGAGAGQIGFAGGDVSYEGILIGTAAGGDAGNDLTVTFNASANSVAIDALIQDLTYANTSNTPTASRTLIVTVTDADGAVTYGPPSFAELTGAANPFDGIDVGYYSSPTLADLDGDGDLDLAVGTNNTRRLQYFENTGTVSAPVFVEQTGAANPFDGIDVGFNVIPTLGDLDGDGDLDAVVGQRYGALRYFQNTGTASAPVFVEQTGAANPFDVATFGAAFDAGYNSAPTLADLDGDGDLDAVVGAYDGMLRTFLNTGTASAPVFAEQTGAANPFNGIDVGNSSTPTLGDLDGDGDLDTVVGTVDGTLHTFLNTGTASTPVFAEQTGAANPFNGLNLGLFSAPTLGDLDGDGLVDAVVGERLGTLDTVQNTTPVGIPIVVNVTAENDAPTGTPTAVLANGTEDTPYTVSAANLLTGFSDADLDTLSVANLSASNGAVVDNGNGTFTVTPSQDFNGLVTLTYDVGDGNGGSVTGVQQTYSLAAVNDVPVLTGLSASVTFGENTVNAAPQILDSDVTFTDPDNNFDTGTLTVSGLLAEDSVAIGNQGAGAGQIGFSAGNVSYEGTSIGTATGGAGATLTVTFNASATSTAIDALIQDLTYANSSDTPTFSRTLTVTVTDADGAATPNLAAPSFAEQTGAANPFDGIDVGSSGGFGGYNSTPTLADLDGDGDLDAVAGEHFTTFHYFENTGTASAPVFVEQTGAANPFGSIGGALDPSVALGDLDGDGDLDAVLGAANGSLRYFENTGTASAPVFAQQVGPANPFDGINVGNYNSAPVLVDLDGDGDFDAVVGEKYGHLIYFLNTGTASAPVFDRQIGAANPFNGIDVGVYSTPTVADLDGDGDLDAVVGGKYGQLLTFQNVGTTSAPVFAQLPSFSDPFSGLGVAFRSAPALADLDGDGDIDAVVGENLGTLHYFQNTPPAGVPIVVNVTAEDDVGVTIVGSKNDDLVDATHTVLGLPQQPLPTGASDTITGDKGNDDLSGLGGGDTIDGGKGNDILHGGAGNDILQAEGKDGEFDIFDGGPDTDTLQVLGKGSTTLAGFDATADSIEIWLGNGKEVKGSDVGDVFDFSGLTSVTGLKFVDADKGDDTLVGSAFADDLRGGKGNDTLRGGTGDDALTGGKGTDAFVFNVGDGNDLVMDFSFDKKHPALDDHIDLTGFGTDYQTDVHDLMTQVGRNVVIDFGGGDTLTILKTTIAILDAHQADFHLV